MRNEYNNNFRLALAWTRADELAAAQDKIKTNVEYIYSFKIFLVLS